MTPFGKAPDAPAKPTGDPCDTRHRIGDFAIFVASYGKPGEASASTTCATRSRTRASRYCFWCLVPGVGVGETFCVNGRTQVSTAPGLFGRIEVNGKLQPSVPVVKVEAVQPRHFDG